MTHHPISFDARVPPHNYDAEQALLGAIMINNRIFERVSEFLRAEHFADLVHGRIYAACAKLIERGQIASPVTLKTFFEHDQDLAELGGMPYLARLAGSVATIINADDYGRLIFDLHLRRELITLAEGLQADAYDITAERPASDVMEAHDGALTALAESGRADKPGLRGAGGFAMATLDEWQAAARGEGGGVTTGIRALDRRLLGGLRPGGLYLLGGRPSMGKTQLAATIALAAARAGVWTDFYSLEMRGSEVTGRLISVMADVDYERCQKGQLERFEWEKTLEAQQELDRLPLLIDDTSGQTLPAIRAQCRRRARRRGDAKGLVVIDYLQLINSVGPRNQQRVHQLEDMTKGLKALAKDIGAPVLLLSQLSRACELREDKRPQLSDLRDSGAIEQDADVVMFVFREEYYLSRTEPTRRVDEDEGKFLTRHAAWLAALQRVHNTAEAIVQKGRYCRTGTARLFCDLSRMHFGDLAQDDDDGGPHG